MVHHEKAAILAHLTGSRISQLPLSAGTPWWIGPEAPQRDFWLIKSALETGVTAILNADVSVVGSPERTLRQASVTVVEVEHRLEKLCNILLSQFHVQSKTRITEEREAAWRALLHSSR